VRAAVYGGATFEARRAAHAALAEALADDRHAVERSWHRAAAALAPDEEVAAELERAAEAAARAGGLASAASAVARGAELSPDADAQARRLAGAAEAALRGGHADRALALADRATELDPAPSLVADLGLVRGTIEFDQGDLDEAYRLLLSAGDVAAPL